MDQQTSFVFVRYDPKTGRLVSGPPPQHRPQDQFQAPPRSAHMVGSFETAILVHNDAHYSRAEPAVFPTSRLATATAVKESTVDKSINRKSATSTASSSGGTESQTREKETWTLIPVSALNREVTLAGSRQVDEETQTEPMEREAFVRDSTSTRGSCGRTVSFHPDVSISSVYPETEEYSNQEASYDPSHIGHYNYDHHSYTKFNSRSSVDKRRKLNFTPNGTEGSTSTPIVLQPKMMDPCFLLPLEIWHQILSYMRPSQMTKASLVSKTWLEATRFHPIWRTICENGQLGIPKRKYRSFMALACASSYWVCEFCLSHNHGRPLMSNIPLEIPIDEYGGEPWSLCLNCRSRYYETHEERSYIHKGNEIYCPDLEGMDSAKNNVWRAHGGFVGALAHTKKTAVARRLLCMARSRDAWESRPSKVANK